ncbi:MAG TPA: pseudaminic acid biosynthesis-associated methylase [Terriglobales bacterium]|nr:pseudaminic acid biosynthesis-associated methylase [Terriglobales bacterium]
MKKQLEQWTGEFGRAYTERNVLDWKLRVPAFREMLKGLALGRVLEVGCNRGHNLLTLREVLGSEPEIVGIEPNRQALEIARASSPQVSVLEGNAYDLPVPDGSFDLVFTAGVLIHIPADDLPRALAEVYRASRQYVLAVEYYAEEETPILYRGESELLWKRDFRKHYQAQFPGLRLLRDGYWDAAQGFDRTNWWLLEKPAGAGKR